MKNLYTFFVVILMAPLCCRAQGGESEYAMDFELGAMKMSLDDLSKIVRKTQGFIVAGRSTPAGESLGNTNKLTIGDGTRGLAVSKDFSLKSLDMAPGQAYEARYVFYASDAPISEVVIELNDNRRRIRVSGHSQELVEGLAQSLREDLRQFETFWGGLRARFVLAFLGVVLMVLVLIKFQTPWMGALMLIMIMAWFFGVMQAERILSGFVVYRGSPSFLTRYGAEISFFGVLMTLLGIALPFIWDVYKVKRGESSAD